MQGHHHRQANLPNAPNEKVYYDVVISNGYTAPNYEDTDASTQDQRTAPILYQSSEYFLSILRLAIPGGSIPIKLMEMQYDPLAPGNVLNTIYSLQIIGPSNTSTAVNLQWLPTDYTARVPPTLVPGQTVYPDYFDFYSLWSIQIWCDMVNVALAACYAQLIGMTSTTAPFLTFDGNTQLFTLWVEKIFTTVDGAQILANTPLSNCFGSSFNFEVSTGPLGYTVHRFIIRDTGVNTATPSGLAVVCLFTTQEYVNVNTSDFVSLTNIFVTSDLSTRLQLEPNFSNTGINRSSANQQRNVLTNFGITNGNIRQDIVYVPQSEYRRIELYNSAPIYGVSLSLFWEDALGNLYPIRIPAGKTANCLLLFEKAPQ